MSGDLLSAKGVFHTLTFDGTVVVIEGRRGSKYERVLPIGLITAVHWSSPMPAKRTIDRLGNIAFSIPGEKFIATRGIANPSAVYFKKPAATDFEVVRDAINAAIEKGSEDSNAPVVRQNPVSVADELKKLADLSESGVLTEAEFEQQKAKLLESD